MEERSITKEEISELPLNQFQGEIFVIEEETHIETIVDTLRGEDVLGFDTETRPSFKKGKLNNISLIQISTLNKAYLFRINKTGLHPAIITLMSDESVLKVGVGIRDDIKGLQRIKSFEPASFVEIQQLAKDNGVNDISLKKLAGIFMKCRISKRQRLSNWEVPQLSQGQLFYAATDAWVARVLFDEMNNCFDIAASINSNNYLLG